MCALPKKGIYLVNHNDCEKVYYLLLAIKHKGEDPNYQQLTTHLKEMGWMKLERLTNTYYKTLRQDSEQREYEHEMFQQISTFLVQYRNKNPNKCVNVAVVQPIPKTRLGSEFVNEFFVES